MAQTNEKSTSKKKILTSALAVALAAVMLTGGTYAYLQDETGEVVNNFKTNDVFVDLAETTGSDYNIIPGTEQAKDPKVTVDNTVDAYVYVEVTDNTDGLVIYEIADGWNPVDGYDNVYYREVAADAEVKEFPVLKNDKVTYDKALENSDMLDENGNLKADVALSFKAYAIQKEPFNDSVLAYKIMNGAVLVTESTALVAALEAGQSVVLSEDVALDKMVEIPAGKSAVLDLNGNTITSNTGTQDRPIVNYGDLTVTGNGTIDTRSADGYGAIRNYGTLTIENGTFIGDDLEGGSAVDNQTGGVATINGGTYYATAAVMNRAGATMTINDGDFEGVSNDNEKYSSDKNWSYGIRNYGVMTINGGYLHGSMNGGIACDSGTVTINGGYFTVEATPSGKTQTYYVLVTNPNAGAQIIVNDGMFEQKNGTDRLIGGFEGMPSWDATDELEANGYTINGGTFILNGENVIVG